MWSDWKEFKVPNTPCNMISKDYAKTRKVITSLEDTYPNRNFCLKGIALGTWQVMYREVV